MRTGGSHSHHSTGQYKTPGHATHSAHTPNAIPPQSSHSAHTPNAKPADAHTQTSHPPEPKPKAQTAPQTRSTSVPHDVTSTQPWYKPTYSSFPLYLTSLILIMPLNSLLFRRRIIERANTEKLNKCTTLAQNIPVKDEGLTDAYQGELNLCKTFLSRFNGVRHQDEMNKLVEQISEEEKRFTVKL